MNSAAASNTAMVLNHLAAHDLAELLPCLGGVFYVHPDDLWPKRTSDEPSLEVLGNLFIFATSVAPKMVEIKETTINVSGPTEIGGGNFPTIAGEVHDLVLRGTNPSRNLRILAAFFCQIKGVPLTTGGVLKKVAQLRARSEVGLELQSRLLDLCTAFAKENAKSWEPSPELRNSVAGRRPPHYLHA